MKNKLKTFEVFEVFKYKIVLLDYAVVEIRINLVAILVLHI